MDGIFWTCQKLVFCFETTRYDHAFVEPAGWSYLFTLRWHESHRLTKLRQLQNHAALWLTCLCVVQKYMHIFVQALGLHMHPQDQKKSTFTPLTLLKTNHGEDTVLTHQMFTYVYMNMATHMQFDQQKPKGLTLTCSLNSKSLMAWLWHAVWPAKA